MALVSMYSHAPQINTSLRSLDMADTDLDIDALIAFVTVLTGNTTIRSINLDRPLLRSAKVNGAPLSSYC